MAQDNRPDESLSVNQVMLAIQRLNPSSFPTNNINVLKAGTVITLPNRAQANELSASQAAIEVRKQYDDWKNGRRTSVPTPVEKAEVTPKVQPIAATSPSQTSDLVDSSEAKLKLVSVDEPKVQASSASESKTEVSQSVAEVADVQPEKEQSGSVIEAEKEDVALQSTQESVPEVIEVTPREQELQALNRDLENQLLVTQESVEKVERDNADLSAKLDSIAEQLQTMQRLIELKDQQVAQLQQQLDQQMQLAQQRNEDPIAAAIEYVRMNPEIVGGSAVAFLLLLLLLVRSSRKPAPYREPEGGAIKTDEVVAEIPSAPSAPLAPSTATMTVVEPPSVELPSVEPAIETPIDPIADQQSDSDSESIAKAEAEIQSMIDEVLRARASEQTVQAEMEASNVDVSEESLPNETDDFLSRANAALSSPEMEEQEIAINDSVESIPESDDLEEFFDSELEASLADTDSVESIVEAVEEESAELQDLDFVIEPFDFGVEDEPQESQIPGVDMPEADSADESPQADTIDEDLVALEAMLGDASSSDDLLDVEVEQEAESNESSEGDWEFVVEESDSGALDADIEKIFDEVDGDVEVVEEINDTAESEDFDTHFYSGADENETRLDLARAYIEMDDYEAARDILISMKEKGSSAQQQEVANLLDQLDKA